MTTLATLTVDLIGNTGGFISNMQKAGKQAEDTGSTIGSALATGAKIAAGAIAAISAVVIGGVKAVTDWGEKLDSIGDVLGTSANESAALAVAIQGVGGNVDGITGQMARLASGLVDTHGKLGTAGQDLHALGITFQTANGKLLPTTTILTNIANKLGNMPDGLEKTRIMTQLFGKSGKDLSDTMTALANGGLDKALKKAEAFGLVIGEDGVNNAVQFDRSMEDVKMALQGLLVQVGNKVLPMLQPLINKFIEWATVVLPKVADFIAVAFKWIGDNVGPIVTGIITGLQIVAQWIGDNWATATGAISGALESARNALAPIWAGIRNVIETVVGQIAQIIRGIFGGIATFVQNHSEEIKTWLAGAWEKIQGIIQQALGIIHQTIVPILQAIADFIRTHADTIQLILGTAWDFIKGVVDGALKNIQNLFQIFSDIFSGNWTKVWEDIKKFVEGLWDELKGVFSGLLNGLVNIMDSIFPGFKKGWDQFWNDLKATVQSVVKWIETAWSDLLAALSGPSGIAAQVKAAYDARNGDVITPHALGGSMIAGWPYLINERGPEPFIPAQNGYMLSHAEAARIFGQAVGGRAGQGASAMIGGDTIVVNNYDSLTAALTNALIEERRTKRLNEWMGG